MLKETPVSSEQRRTSVFLLGNDLNGAARFLYLFCRALAEFMGAHMQSLRQFAVSENFDILVEALYDPMLSENNRIDLSTGIKSRQSIQIDRNIVLSENVRKSALRQPAVQRHLAAFKPRSHARAGARHLSVIAAGRSFSMPGAHTPADTLILSIRPRGWFQCINAQHNLCPIIEAVSGQWSGIGERRHA